MKQVLKESELCHGVIVAVAVFYHKAASFLLLIHERSRVYCGTFSTLCTPFVAFRVVLVCQDASRGSGRHILRAIWRTRTHVPCIRYRVTADRPPTAFSGFLQYGNNPRGCKCMSPSRYKVFAQWLASHLRSSRHLPTLCVFFRKKRTTKNERNLSNFFENEAFSVNLAFRAFAN